MGIRILVVEESSKMRDDLVQSMLDFGLNAQGVGLPGDMDTIMASESFEMLVVSHDLEGENGLSITRRMRRANPNMGIILLSKYDELSTKILGHQLGADGFMLKPVNHLELISVIESLARRLKLLIPNNDPFWMLDRHKLELRFVDPEEAIVELTPIETKLLSSFAQSDSGMVEKDQLITALGEDPDVYDLRRLETAISRLRRKVCSAHPEQNECIKSVRNKGYQFLSKIKILS